jgi:hypothetical protein
MVQNPKKNLSHQNDHFAIIFAAPILPGRSEGWRRFLQEMMESRRPEYEESRRRLGISQERAWIAETAHGNVAVVAVVAAQPEQVLARLATSELAVDRWYREQLLALQGFDLAKPLSRASPELVLEWQPSNH